MRFVLGFVVVSALIALGGLLLGGGIVGVTPDGHIEITQERAIRMDLREKAGPDELNRLVNEALDRDDYEDAVMYRDIARFASIPLTRATLERLDRAGATAVRVVRDTSQFVRGAVTGEVTSTAALAGAVTADFTVVGDIRDLTIEGGKMIAGEEYSQFILGLSVVGLAATGATLATGGGALPAKLGVSVLKVAKRAGTLTVEFGQVVTRLIREAVDFPGLKEALRPLRRGDEAATRAALDAYTRSVREAEIFHVVTRLGELGSHAGRGESVRLLKYVRSTKDLDNLTEMSKVLGRKTRGVVELTGKTSLRAFKTTVRIVDFLLRNLLAFLSWLGALLGTAFARRLFGRRG